MFEWARGVSGWIAIAHKSYGRWDWFRQLQWADAWMLHCRETDNMKHARMVWALPVYRTELT